MELEQIFKLLDAGYTKDEITAMTAPKEQAAVEAPKEPTTEQTPKEPTTTEQAVSDLTKQVESIANIIKDMQALNVKNAKQEVQAEHTADSAIRSFFSK